MMNYIKMVLHALWKKMLISLAGIVVTGVLVWLKLGMNKPLPMILGLMLLAWLLLWVLLLVLVASSMKKDQPLEDIMTEHGYCDEWLQKHSELYPNPSRSQKLRRVDVLSFLGRYDEAKALLESISTFDMNDDQKYEYLISLFDMLLTTRHYAEAMALFEKNRGWLDTYAGMQPVRGAAYCCNSAVILAIYGDFEGSQHYLEIAERTVASQKGMSLVIPMITKTMQLYAMDLIAPAEEQEQKTYEYIISPESNLPKQWQRDHFLAVLGRAQYLTPEHRQEDAK